MAYPLPTRTLNPRRARTSVLRIGLLQDRREMGGTGAGGKIQVWRVEKASDTAGSGGDEHSCIRDTPVQKGSHTSLEDLRPLVRPRLSHPILPVLAGRVCERVCESVRECV